MADSKQDEAANGAPLYVSNPEKWLEETVKESDVTGIVIFRGSWCKYDRHYLKKLGHYHNATMKGENVKLIAWTSEGAEGAAKADKEWGLTTECGYDLVIGDETLGLAKYLKEDELLPDLAIATPEELGVQGLITPGTYPNGIVLPGQAWWAHHGMVVFEWDCKFDPAAGLVGGPGRPDPTFVWEQVKKRKHALDIGNAVMPVHGDDIKYCTTDVEVMLSSCSLL
jgi:hypothetical protein